MKTSFSYALLVLCAALLSASSAWANIVAPGNVGMPVAPPPPVTVNLGSSPDAATSSAGTGPIAVIQAFPNEQSSKTMDGGSVFWLGMLGLLGVTLFATGTTLIVQSANVTVQETVKTAKVRMAPVSAVRKTATV